MGQPTTEERTRALEAALFVLVRSIAKVSKAMMENNEPAAWDHLREVFTLAADATPLLRTSPPR